jgi:hypothetical protein
MLEAFTFDMERQGLSVQTFPIESNLKNINFDQEQTDSWAIPQSGSCANAKAAHIGWRVSFAAALNPQSGVRSDLS